MQLYYWHVLLLKIFEWNLNGCENHLGKINICGMFIVVACYLHNEIFHSMEFLYVNMDSSKEICIGECVWNRLGVRNNGNCNKIAWESPQNGIIIREQYFQSTNILRPSISANKTFPTLKFSKSFFLDLRVRSINVLRLSILLINTFRP